MRVLACALLASICVFAAACSSSQSSRCRDMCQHEARCVRELRTLRQVDVPFDEAECIAACTALDRDPQVRPIVDEHAECIEGAGMDCEAVLACR